MLVQITPTISVNSKRVDFVEQFTTFTLILMTGGRQIEIRRDVATPEEIISKINGRLDDQTYKKCKKAKVFDNLIIRAKADGVTVHHVNRAVKGAVADCGVHSGRGVSFAGTEMWNSVTCRNCLNGAPTVF